jgi:Sulfotransferase domain
VSRPPVLPNFLIIGAAKSGTTSLAHYLRSHPQVYLANFELHYFVAERRWRLGPAWYEAQFTRARDEVAVGEKSPSYTRHPRYREVPGRIAAQLPGVRLIYLVRHPLQRIRSEYLHRVLNGRERRPLDEAVLADPSYVDTSRYALQIEQYLQHFDRAQLLVLTAEDLRNDRAATLAQVQTFIGVTSSWQPPELEREYNRTSQRPVRRPVARPLRRLLNASVRVGMPPRTVERLSYRSGSTTVDLGSVGFSDTTRSRLQEELRDDVRRLRGHLGPEFDGWGIV